MSQRVVYESKNEAKFGLKDALSNIRSYVFEEDIEGDSALHNDMNRWGAMPLAGLITGLGRTVYGTVEFASGVIAALCIAPIVNLALRVQQIIRALIGGNAEYFRLSESFERNVNHLVFDGGAHIRTGLKEILTLGCHQRIANAFRYVIQRGQCQQAAKVTVAHPASSEQK